MTESEQSPLWSNVIFILLLVIAIAIIAAFIWSQMNGANLWADYYAKETSRLINLGASGDKIEIDIHKAATIAKRNEVLNLKEIATINNPQNEICFKLSLGAKTCYSYFNNVDVINLEIISAAFSETERTTLTFELTENQRPQEEENVLI